MGAILIATITTVLVMFALRPVAVAVGLLDRPGGRKIHEGEIPVIGGMAMYAGLAFGMLALTGPRAEHSDFLMAGALLLGVGVIDDRFHLSPWLRLVAQLAAGLFMVEAAGVELLTLGAVLGGEPVELGRWSLLFTLLATAGAVNAYNMMDGLDGLAGGMACVALGSLAAASMVMGNASDAATLAVMVGSIAGFLLFNLPLGFNQAIRAFMGDAGSTVLGFAVAWYGIKLTQSEGALIPPVTILWITALPLMELVTSCVRRLVSGRSPFSADAEHFHHLLRRTGLTVRGTFSLLFAVQLSFAGLGIGLALAGVPDAVSLILMLGLAGSAAAALLNAPALGDTVRRGSVRRRAEKEVGVDTYQIDG